MQNHYEVHSVLLFTGLAVYRVHVPCIQLFNGYSVKTVLLLEYFVFHYKI